MRNGGFGQYFGALGSGAPGAARAALEGLDRFGAAEHRRLLEAAMALFERGLPTEPPPQADPEPGVPRTEERYDATVRHAVIGMMDPDLETLRQRRRSRDRRVAALRAVYGALDDAYRALASEGSPLERFWVAYARAHPGEFFTR